MNPVITKSGYKMWYQGDGLHRLDGPAVIYPNGTKVWYINDARCHSWHEFQEQSGLSNEEMSLLILKYGEIE